MKAFESFRYISSANRPWKYYTDSTNTFTAWAPVSFKWQFTDPVNRLGLAVSYDSIAAISYNVTVDTVNKYYLNGNDSLFWNAAKRSVVALNDSLISSKFTSNEKINRGEFLVRKKRSNMYQRILIFLHGNRQIMLIVTSQLKDLYDDNAQKFFNDFRILTGTATPND
jgi:hypothetical protein